MSLPLPRVLAALCAVLSSSVMAQTVEAVEDVSTLDHKLLFALGLVLAWALGFNGGQQP